MSDVPRVPDPWAELRRYTQARIALGRVGSSQKTEEILEFSMAHARAKDAVHLPFEMQAVSSGLNAAGFATIEVRSQAENRSEYLKRPDLGRLLHPDSHALLRTQETIPHDRLTVVVADGLSALACSRHAVPLLLALQVQLSGWSIDRVVVAAQARVALSDPIGLLREAEAALILLGERPGLSSPDSLGAYLTYQPRPGRSDAERNCVSNIRPEGLPYSQAAFKLSYLLEQSRRAGRSGVTIKDASALDALSELELRSDVNIEARSDTPRLPSDPRTTD